MDKHPCVTALQRGCHDLHIPESCAKELVRYLFVRKVHQYEEGVHVLCSALLDKLQRWMLLETDVKVEVEKLLGSIRHSQHKITHENALIHMKLKAMEAMAAEGWAPNLKLWEEPGTEMENITQVTVRVTDREHQEQEVTVYTCSGSEQFDLRHARELLRDRGYMISEVNEDTGRKRRREDGNAAGPVVYTACCGTFQIFCKTPTGKTLTVECPHNATIQQLKRLIHARDSKFPPEDQNLIFAGKQLVEGSRTIEYYGLRKESTLTIIPRLRGC